MKWYLWENLLLASKFREVPVSGDKCGLVTRKRLGNKVVITPYFSIKIRLPPTRGHELRLFYTLILMFL